MKSFVKDALFVVLLCLMSVSCRENIEIRRALIVAGNNKGELVSVLNHYNEELKKAENNDTLDLELAKQKLSAAKFLIKNMPGHMALSGDYQEYYDKSKRIFELQELSTEQKTELLDSLTSSYKDKISSRPVIYMITAEYMIRDIDAAFAEWKEGDWARHLDFDLFCEYILPFTCSQRQPIFDWRTNMKTFAYGSIGNLYECYDYRYNPKAAIEPVNTMLNNMVSHQSKVTKSHPLPIFDDSLFVKYPNAASCEETADMATLILRSKGIPVAIDFTPQWPDRSQGHSWCIFWSLYGKAEEYNAFGYPLFKPLRFAKIFRQTYAANKEYMKDFEFKRNVYQVTGTQFFADVSDEYMATSDIEIKLLERVPGNLAYIAVFDNFEWHPVWYGKVRRHKVKFEKMGRDVTYIVLAFKHDELVPVSLPFRLDRLGNITYIQQNDSHTVNMHLLRKFPMHQHVYLVFTQRNGMFEASNDLKQWDTLARLPKWPLTSGIAEIPQNKEYRYWRFSSKRISDMAEIFFYDKTNEKPRADYCIIGASDGFEKLFDKDPLTYFRATKGMNNGCVDFGRPVSLSRIEYIHRGDGNAIMPGDKYEVSWWDIDHWELLKSCIAEHTFLDVNDAPSDALYYVKDTSSGIENRIFTWDEENGEAIWN